MIFSPPPCSQDCPDRQLRCHSDCPAYSDWCADKNRKSAELRKRQAVDNGFLEDEINSYIKHVLKANSRRIRGVKAW